MINSSKPSAHAVHVASAGTEGWWWACECGAHSVRATPYARIAERGAAAHVSAEHRKLRYAAAATKGVDRQSS